MTASNSGDIFQPGDLLNNTYRIENILGKGGTSEVYKARSEISGRVIAIKALRAEYSSNEDFLVLMTREEDIRDVRHDAIVRYFDTQRMPNGVVYLVMDYVDGPGLDQKQAEGGMSADDLMVVGARVCEGLIAAHELNIVHRDLSPDNIILRNNAPGEAVIIDFGIAKDTNPGAETIVGNEFAGKYAYAAPEQLSGKTDHRSDLYALGALLLSTFRGKKPDIGRNPMEVVEKKGQPVDVEGVPEPLRSLIAKMCDPDPENRFDTARALLEAFRNPTLAISPSSPTPPQDQDDLDDATIIAPKPKAKPEAQPQTPVPAPQALGIPKPKPAESPAPAKQSRSPLGLVIGLIAVGGLGAGAFFSGALDGVFGPSYPPADPFALIVQKQADGSSLAVGNVPSPEIEAELSNLLASLGGTAELTLATGNIQEGWGAGLMDVMQDARQLEEFRLAIQDNRMRLSGLAASRADLNAIEASFADGFPQGFDGALDIQLGPRFLTADALAPLLTAQADCGPLQLLSPPPIGYGLEDTIIVTGRFAQQANRDALRNALVSLAGDRPVRIEAETLNEGLCLIDDILPNAVSGGFDITLGFGDRLGENLSGRYKVGDNPTIDVAIPDGITSGYLWVSVIDVKGVVFHLLPNLIRPDNNMATLTSEVENGLLRVAYGKKEAEGTGRLAFDVDASVLGKSKIVVFYSEQKLFEDLRPTTESVASYAEALSEARETGALFVKSLDTAILTTEE